MSSHNHQHPFEEALGLGLTVPLPPGTLTSSRRSHHNDDNGGIGREDGNATSMPNSFTGATLVPLSRNGNTCHPPTSSGQDDGAPAPRSISLHPPPGRDPYPRDGTVGIDDHYHVNDDYHHEEEYSGDEMDRYYARKYEEELDDEIVPYSRPVHSDLDEDSDDDGDDTDAEYDGEGGGEGDVVADEGGREEENDDEDDGDGEDSSSEESVVSLTPPPSLPLLVVNLNRLCGYDPSGVEEADALRRRIEEELLGSVSNKSSQPAGATEEAGGGADSENPLLPPPPPERSNSGSASPSSVVDTPCSTTTGDALVVSTSSAAAAVAPTAMESSGMEAAVATAASPPRQYDVTDTDESPPAAAEGHLEGEVVATENDADADAGGDDGGGEDRDGRGGGEGSTESSSFRGGAAGAVEREAETGGPRTTTEGSDADARGETAVAPSRAPPVVVDVVTVGDGVSLNFSSRSEQLFDAGVASHADTSVLAMPMPARPSRSRSRPDDVDGEADGRDGDEYHSRLLVVRGTSGRRNVYYCALPYPEYLGAPSSSSSGSGRKQSSVSRSWKILLRPHPIPPVQTILSLLAKSSRPLPWKMEMNECIRSLAKTESTARQRRMQKVALEHWRNVDRPERLDGLYETRDVFRDRLDDAEVRLDVLRRRRLESTSCELARRRYGGGVGEGAVKDDLAGETFDFLLRDDVDGADDGVVVDDEDDAEEYYGSGEDDDDDDDEGDDARGRRRRRREPRPRTHRGRPTKGTTAEAVDPRNNNDERDRRWREEKRRILASSVTPEERAAEALVDGLRRRLARVDDLLESLQEEEWAEEEEYEGEGPNEAFEAEPVGDVDTQDGGLGLLDQILAMIMGSQPDPELERLMAAAKTDTDGGERVFDDGVVVSVQEDDGDGMEEELERRKKKFLRLRSCHEDTVRAWREHFGRLPRLAPTGSSSSRVSAAEEARLDRGDGGATTGGFGAAADGDSNNLDKSGEHVQRITTNRLSGDEGSEWEQVENWEDLVLPDHNAACDPNRGTSEATTTAMATNVNSGSIAPTSVVEKKAPSFGLRPGGRLKHTS